jgi:hypothetical protein
VPTERALFQIAAAGIASIVVGSLGPWATFLGFSIGGLDTDGTYTLAFGAMAGLALWRAWAIRTTGMMMGSAVLAGIVLATAIYDYQHIARGEGADDARAEGGLTGEIAASIIGSVSVGWGLYLVLAGAGVAVAASLAMWWQWRSARGGYMMREDRVESSGTDE